MALPFRRNVPATTDDDARTWWAEDFLTVLRAATHLRLLVLASLGQLIPSVNKRPLSCAGISATSRRDRLRSASSCLAGFESSLRVSGYSAGGFDQARRTL